VYLHHHHESDGDKHLFLPKQRGTQRPDLYVHGYDDWRCNTLVFVSGGGRSFRYNVHIHGHLESSGERDLLLPQQWSLVGNDLYVYGDHHGCCDCNVLVSR
jgi:hypothetical protein